MSHLNTDKLQLQLRTRSAQINSERAARPLARLRT